MQNQLEDLRIKAEKREDEIEELYTLQDELEQYLRKNSLEIHGIPESAYKSIEDAVIHVAKTLYVVIVPEDIDISHMLHLTAAWLSQLGERRSAEREVAGSNPVRTNTQGV